MAIKFNAKKTGIFAAGVLFGTAGIKILSSKDAKKLYTACTAAVLRAKKCVMKTVTAVCSPEYKKPYASSLLRDVRLSLRGTTLIHTLCMLSSQIRTPETSFPNNGLISSCHNGQAPAKPTLCSARCSKASSNLFHNCLTPTDSSLSTSKVLLFLVFAFLTATLT